MALGRTGKFTPRHVAVNITDVKPAQGWLENHVKSIRGLIKEQIDRDIPILSIRLPCQDDEEIHAYKKLLSSLIKEEFLHTHQMKVMVIGDWYELSTSVVEIIKQVMDVTREYDKFFLALFINYDGRSELIKGLRVITRKVQEHRLSAEEITAETIKDNLASSYFVPPELIVETSTGYSGFLLWDAVGAVVYYEQKQWPCNAQECLSSAFTFYDHVRKQ